jgi:hypothetical protein
MLPFRGLAVMQAASRLSLHRSDFEGLTLSIQRAAGAFTLLIHGVFRKSGGNGTALGCLK